jgi:hypothetical protein
MIGRTVPARPACFFAGRTLETRAVTGAVLPSHLFHTPAHEVRRQGHARALRAAFINYSLYTRNIKKSGTVGKVLILLWFIRPTCLDSGGTGGAYACGAIASVVICPLFSGTSPLISGVAACPTCCHRIGGV